MPILTAQGPSGQRVQFNIYKRLSTLGAGADVDVSVRDPHMPPLAAYISQADGAFTLVIPPEKKPVLVGGKPSRKLALNDTTEFILYQTLFRFEMVAESKPKESASEQQSIVAYRRLLEFSQKIAQETDIEALLKTLLLEITQVTKAEHGFLVLMENNKPVIKAQQHVGPSPVGSMSDSIVRKVIEQGEPVILSDALNDQEFCGSSSVINFRLTSVMCTPLMYQGNILGAIYVGNNSLVNAFDNNSLETMTIYSSQAAMLVQNALHISSLKKHTKTLQESLELAKFGGIIGSCSGMQEVFTQVEKVSKTDVSVLIVGETGTGKDLIARELHNRSLRKDGPFVVVNCGATPENLLESELFGHIRGAFAGATHSRMGKFQSARLGTLFLDEIQSIPSHLQVALLQALHDRKVTPVGDNKSYDIDVRIIAATNRDLHAMIKQGTFREDLYYRINVLQITAPPLRERGNDVLVLANFFLQKYAKIYGKVVVGLDEEAQNAVLNYHWPANVRQLENRIRRAIVMCDAPRITASDLDIGAGTNEGVLSLSDAIERYRSRYIKESLERNAGNKTKTASELGVDPRTIFRHLEQIKKIDSGDGQK